MTADFDVVVVGLGHAGCEAALASARMGLRTLGITLKRDRIALMSCNPAIGGTAKGHLVRELDALGGQMGRAADLTGTHFKTLNESKGPAVRATRVLCDRSRYAAQMQATVESQPGLQIHEGQVTALRVEGGAIRGVRLETGEELSARAVVLTTGTFLQALMHVGERKEVGGRLGDAAATGLSGALRALGFELGRFKTGTPARLRRDSIDWARCEPQPGDATPLPFSLRTVAARARGERFPAQQQLQCHITWTTRATHALLRENLHRSPLYQGEIVGRGPRYCPSLEDKVVRFAARERHQVFLEPEGPESELVYPAGLSTSLPADVQRAFLQTIPGLEQVEVVRYGYAVEYDYAPPTQLWPTLETRRVAGLYFGGQLNGTSGYEEAAIQGLLAGVNAGLKLRKEPALVLGRSEAHAGVLVDELVTRGVDEPFRMLTSRSEHRLRLREGNADLRLRASGHRVGLVSTEELRQTQDRAEQIAAELRRLERSGLTARLRRPEVTYRALRMESPDGWPELPLEVASEVEIEVKYAGYIAQHDRAMARESTGLERVSVPADFDFHAVRGLSREVAEKLSQRRPETLAEARQVPGVTPAALSLLLLHVRRAVPADGGGCG